MIRVLVKNLSRNFTTVSPPPQFLNYYLVKLEYGVDGYYETYQYRKVFDEEVKKIQENQQAKILGGDNFPKKSTTLIFNCNSIDIPNRFIQSNIYSSKKLVTNVKVTEMEKISTEKFERVWHFYQAKLK